MIASVLQIAKFVLRSLHIETNFAIRALALRSSLAGAHAAGRKMGTAGAASS